MQLLELGYAVDFSYSNYSEMYVLWMIAVLYGSQ